MARQAGLLVVRNLSGRMEIDEIASVVRRAQVDPSEMAFLATERIVDLGVANQAVRHERKVSLVCQIGLPNTPMARLAGIPGIEMLPCAAGFAEIRPAVNGGGDQRSYVPQAQVELVVEAVRPGLGLEDLQTRSVDRRCSAAFVADGALVFGRDKDVGRGLTLPRRSVAVQAGRVRFDKVQAM